VPQLITDVFGAESLGNQQRNKEMQLVMETDFFEPSTFFDLRKERIEKIGVKLVSILVWKKQSNRFVLALLVCRQKLPQK
jgi:hypothetical protein